MRISTRLIAALAIICLGACKRTANGDIVIKRPADVNVKTTEDTLHLPSVSHRTDTVNAPVVGVQKETVVVSKPVVGTRKTAVQVPVVHKP
jgi:hypothetical protein